MRHFGPGTAPPVENNGALAAMPSVVVPKTKDELAQTISQGCARALACSTSAKELAEAIKAAREWYATLYPDSDPSKGFGGKLTGGADGGA